MDARSYTRQQCAKTSSTGARGKPRCQEQDRKEQEEQDQEQQKGEDFFAQEEESKQDDTEVGIWIKIQNKNTYQTYDIRPIHSIFLAS